MNAEHSPTPETHAQKNDLQVLWLGTTDYSETWQLQKNLQQQLIKKEIPSTLIICEHNPVITAGKSTKSNSLLITHEELKEKQIDYFEVERGGDITYHGPGQIVFYPIIDLNLKKKDVAWYMRTLEQAVINCLTDYELDTSRIAGKTGVWIERPNTYSKDKKIASIGVRISRWCTMHGLALNVHDCNSGFSMINPCGYNDIEITSIEQEKKNHLATKEVADNLLLKFCDVFGYNVLSEESVP